MSEYWGDEKAKKITLIPNGGLASFVINQPNSLIEIAEKIRCQCEGRDPIKLAYDLLYFPAYKGLHGETQKEMAFTIWEVTDMWNNIATMLFRVEDAFKEIDDEMSMSEQDHYLRAYIAFKDAEAEFKQHEEMFNKCCKRLNDKYGVNNLEAVKKYLSQF